MRLQTRFLILIGLILLSFLVDGFMIFLQSRGYVSAATVSTSIFVVHFTRGTLSVLIIFSAFVDIYERRISILRK